MRRWAIVIVGLVLAVTCSRRPQSLTLATTTTVDNSGLLAVLLPEFEKATGIKVNPLTASNGRALDILVKGDADLALTNDPDAEQHLMDQGRIGLYRKVMFNDLVIAGPRHDPAGISKAKSAAEAMALIASTNVPFASRGDSSAVHFRELALWKIAGRKSTARRYVETGQGMAATLRVASDRQAYVLTDRATFRQNEGSLKLRVLFEGDAALLNTYAVTFTSALTGDRLERARRFVIWLTDQAGRDLVAGYRQKGQFAFFIWPAGSSRDLPRDVPESH